MKRASFFALAIVLACLLAGCDILMNLIDPPKKLEISIASDKTEYEYNEKILITLEAVYEEGREVSISWTLDGQDLAVDNPQRFNLFLRPKATTSYTLKATANDGITTTIKEIPITVHKFAHRGTWKATNEPNPAYAYNMDIVGIWTEENFELYYYAANGGTVLKTYSARGSVEFIDDSPWVKLTEEKYYNQFTTSWLDWTYNDGIMWVRYSVIDANTVGIDLDMHSPADTAEYAWEFTKQSDSVEPLH